MGRTGFRIKLTRRAIQQTVGERNILTCESRWQKKLSGRIFCGWTSLQLPERNSGVETHQKMCSRWKARRQKATRAISCFNRFWLPDRKSGSFTRLCMDSSFAVTYCKCQRGILDVNQPPGSMKKLDLQVLYVGLTPLHPGSTLNNLYALSLHRYFMHT